LQKLAGSISGLFKSDIDNVEIEIQTKLKSIAYQYHKKSILTKQFIEVCSRNYSYKIKKEYENIINKRLAKLDSLIKSYEIELTRATDKKGHYDKAVKDIYEEERKLIFLLSRIDGNPSIVEFNKLTLQEVMGIAEDCKEFAKQKEDARKARV